MAEVITTVTQIDAEQGCTYGKQVRTRIEGIGDYITARKRNANLFEKIGAEAVLLDTQRDIATAERTLDVVKAALMLCDICQGNPLDIAPEERYQTCPVAIKMINLATQTK